MDEDSREALARISATVEASRYSRGLDEVPDDMLSDVRHVMADVSTRQSVRTKLRAALFPRSLFTNLLSRD